MHWRSLSIAATTGKLVVENTISDMFIFSLPHFFFFFLFSLFSKRHRWETCYYLCTIESAFLFKLFLRIICSSINFVCTVFKEFLWRHIFQSLPSKLNNVAVLAFFFSLILLGFKRETSERKSSRYICKKTNLLTVLFKMIFFLRERWRILVCLT